jgi:hypothetical protein
MNMDRRKAILGGTVVLVLAAAAWAFGLLGGTDQAIAKLQEIGDKMSDDNLPEAQRDQLRDRFRQQMQTLSDDQRRAFFEANRSQWEARSAERMNQFFAMPQADQQKRLDEIINRMNQPRDSQRQAGGRGQNGANANNSNGGRGGRSMSEAQREERSKRRLDRSSPKQRAQYTAFRQMLDKRAQQRGIKLDDGWGRRG